MCLSCRSYVFSMSGSLCSEAVNSLRASKGGRGREEKVEEVLGSHSGSYQAIEKGHLITQADVGRCCAAVFSLSSGMPDARVLSWLPKQLITWKDWTCASKKTISMPRLRDRVG